MAKKKKKTRKTKAITAKNGQQILDPHDRHGLVKRDQKGRLARGSILNPAGSGTAGQSLLQLVNKMNDWPRAQLNKMSKDPQASNEQIAACNWLLRCSSTEVTKGGSYIATTEVQNLLDRTVGRPAQAIEIQGETRATHVLAILNGALEDDDE